MIKNSDTIETHVRQLFMRVVQCIVVPKKIKYKYATSSIYI